MTNKGETAMQYACGYGSVELVKYLENLGATIEQKSNMDCDGVHEAFYTSNLAVIDYLNEQEFDFNYKSTVEHKTPLHYLLENKNISSEKKIFVIQKYLHKLDTTITDNDGKTPLDYAKEYCPETISYLSEHHQDTMILNIDLANDNLPLAGDHFDAHSHDYS
jgi:ankyrin repeat protein